MHPNDDARDGQDPEKRSRCLQAPAPSYDPKAATGYKNRTCNISFQAS